MFRKKRERESESGIFVMVPFMKLKLSHKGAVEEFVVENHFIAQLKPEERILLASRKLPTPEHARSGLVLSLAFPTGSTLLNAIVEGYNTVLTKIRETETSRVAEQSHFGRKFLSSEFRRLFFGGMFEKPPQPTISEHRRMLFLKSLYEMSFLKKGEKPVLLEEKSFYVPFTYIASEKIFRPEEKKYDRIARVLTGLAKRGKINLSETSIYRY